MVHMARGIVRSDYSDNICKYLYGPVYKVSTNNREMIAAILTLFQYLQKPQKCMFICPKYQQKSIQLGFIQKMY